MDKRLLMNNILIGLIVLFVWIYDFHLVRRLSFKIDRETMNVYKELRGRLKEHLNTVRTSVDCKEIEFKSQDTIYLTFVNFKSLNNTTIDGYADSYKDVYNKIFPGILNVRVYVKSIQSKATSLIGLVNIVKHEFSGIHVQNQHIYEVYLFNEFFDSQMIKDQNRVFIKTSKNKLSEVGFIEDVTRQSVYYFKKLKTIYEINQRTSKGLLETYVDEFFNCTLQKLVYYIDSLEYVNGNRNLVFFAKYLDEIKDDARHLNDYVANKSLIVLERVLLKNDFYIYTTSYMYEDY